MSEPVSNAEVEDVLSSIRRLVSEEKRGTPPQRHQAVSDRLVLTPALRVAEDPDSPSPDEAVPQEASSEGAGSEQIGPEETDVEETGVEEAGVEEAGFVHVGPDGDDSATGFDADEAPAQFRHGEFRRGDTNAPEAEQHDAGRPDDDRNPDADRRDEDHENEGHHDRDHHDGDAHDAWSHDSGGRDVEAPAAADHGHSPYADAFDFSDEDDEGWDAADEETDAQAAFVHKGPAGDGPDDAAGQAHQADAEPEADADAAPDDDWAEEDELLGAESDAEDDDTDDETDDAADDDLTGGDLTGGSADDDDLSDEAADNATNTLSAKIAALETAIGRIPEEWEPDDTGADDYSGTEGSTMDWEDHVEFDARGVPLRDPADAAPRPTARAPEPDVEDVFGDDDEQLIDEEALRDLVAEIVRSELQGALGERITRNVRKLVRREIHRALTARELE